MEVGRLGVHGTHAVKAVDPVGNSAHEAAQNRRLATVVELALGHPERSVRATLAAVQVKTLGVKCVRLFYVICIVPSAHVSKEICEVDTCDFHPSLFQS